ncbi:MAG: hypothetical protein Dasosvirus6_5 [Dasosvirus sp.]|uniref:Ankyrin repeat protein n=1 Tax=Dasosvirus sp. TaxID=2487764 RepID=A0A3G4ZV96_9VIRU|nr:MAG: hypothetical protein Dasosvirus6_5 [Dasosvirus sp.]
MSNFIRDNIIGIFKSNKKYEEPIRRPKLSGKQGNLLLRIMCNEHEYVFDRYNEVLDHRKKQYFFARALCHSDMKIIRFLEQKYNVKKNFIENEEFFKEVIKLNRNVDVIKYAIDELKMNLEYFDIKTGNYLMIACEYNCLDVVKYLIEERKMNPNCLDIFGCNCLTRSIQGYNDKIIKYLSDKMDVVYAVKKICEIEQELRNKIDNILTYLDFRMYSMDKCNRMIVLSSENYIALNYLLEFAINMYGKAYCFTRLELSNINPLILKKKLLKIFSIHDPFTLDYITFTKLVDKLSVQI